MAKNSESSKSPLELATEILNKKFGEGIIIQGQGSIMDVESVPTGIASLDQALGCGGIPRGRIIEIYGPESGGKTTTTLQVVSSYQQTLVDDRYGVAAFIDAEHALDPDWAAKIGVDMDELIISQPGSGEAAIEVAETLIRSGAVDIVVVDSVAALVPQKELDGDIGDSHVGLQARLMSQAMRKLTKILSTSKCSIIFVNQIREKIGVMFGSNETTPGGRALKFYSSVRIEVKRGASIKEGGDDGVQIGNQVNARVVKNKVAPPFKACKYNIMYDNARGVYGPDIAGSLLDVAVEVKVVRKNGTHYYYGDQALGNGQRNACAFLSAKDRKELRDAIRDGVMAASKKEDAEEEEEAEEEVEV